MKKKLLTILSLLITFVLIYIFFLRSNGEIVLLEKGNTVIEKIENFKSRNGYLPSNLLDIKETEEGPIFYERKDSLNYIVYFGTSLGESMIYYSDSKKWEDRLR
jgi:hypothetical protein